MKSLIIHLIFTSSLSILMMARIEASDLITSSHIIKKVQANHITKATKAIGLQTFTGAVYKVSDIKKTTTSTKSLLWNALQSPQIELQNGEILYPFEIEYGILKKAHSKIIERSMINGRIPSDEED